MELLLIIVVGLVVLLVPVAAIVILIVFLVRRSGSTVADPRIAQAANPATPGVVLQQLAADAPHLRATIAANPSAYPELLAWLGQLGDPAVDAALRSR